MQEVMHWMVPLLLINLGLTVLAIYLIARAIRRIHHYDRLIEEFKRKHSKLADLLD
jgi:cytochrome c-type biogenesis protein CcmH/NrfF